MHAFGIPVRVMMDPEGEPMNLPQISLANRLQSSTVLTGSPAPSGFQSCQYAQRQSPHPCGSAAAESRPCTAAADSAMVAGALPSTAYEPCARHLHVPMVPGRADPELRAAPRASAPNGSLLYVGSRELAGTARCGRVAADDAAAEASALGRSGTAGCGRRCRRDAADAGALRRGLWPLASRAAAACSATV